MGNSLNRGIISLIGVGIGALLICFVISQASAYNDDRRGIAKWNPYFLSSNTRYPYADPVSYYGGMSRDTGVGMGFPKRLGERSSLFGTTQQIYKWSPVYFSDRGLFGGGGQRYLNVISNDALDSTES